MAEAVTRSVFKETIVPLLLLGLALVGAVYFITVMGVEPIVAGFITLEFVGLVWLGSFLVKKGILKKQDLPYYYFGAFAFIIFTYGLIKAGYLPIISTSTILPLNEFEVYAVTTSVLLGILFFIIAVTIFALFYVWKKPLIKKAIIIRTR